MWRSPRPPASGWSRPLSSGTQPRSGHAENTPGRRLRRTQDLMLTNRVLTAAEALEWGLLHRVVA
ncbi:hypothetical protein ACWDOP_36675, partial [Nocardia sp. NPDC003693]